MPAEASNTTTTPEAITTTTTTATTKNEKQAPPPAARTLDVDAEAVEARHGDHPRVVHRRVESVHGEGGGAVDDGVAVAQHAAHQQVDELVGAAAHLAHNKKAGSSAAASKRAPVIDRLMREPQAWKAVHGRWRCADGRQAGCREGEGVQRQG
jgi:hypothetical protein